MYVVQKATSALVCENSKLIHAFFKCVILCLLFSHQFHADPPGISRGCLSQQMLQSQTLAIFSVVVVMQQGSLIVSATTGMVYLGSLGGFYHVCHHNGVCDLSICKEIVLQSFSSGFQIKTSDKYLVFLIDRYRDSE